jgi:hypothetical protein
MINILLEGLAAVSVTRYTALLTEYLRYEKFFLNFKALFKPSFEEKDINVNFKMI